MDEDSITPPFREIGIDPTTKASKQENVQNTMGCNGRNGLPGMSMPSRKGAIHALYNYRQTR